MVSGQQNDYGEDYNGAILGNINIYTEIFLKYSYSSTFQAVDAGIERNFPCPAKPDDVKKDSI